MITADRLSKAIDTLHAYRDQALDTATRYSKQNESYARVWYASRAMAFDVALDLLAEVTA